MKKRVAVCVLALFAIVVLATPAVGADRIFSITLTGEGEVCAVPDKAEIFIRINGMAQTQKLAVEAQAERMHSVMDFLRKRNVPSKDMSTLNYLCGPRYEYDKSQQKRILVEYVASQNLKIRISKDAVGAIIDGVSIWAFVENITFVVSNQKELFEKAIALAIEDAKSKARKRASALGIKLGAVIGYQENLNHPLQRGMRNEMSSLSDRGSSVPTIPVGENEIRATVSITYEIIVLRKN
ncbi:SIMPL domain-containing protein [Patescibacteria group bacterium]|nr:SIMPL domain-containing protein [Patescibacteria group bacterium]